MAWSKITFYYKHQLTNIGLSATSKQSGYLVESIIDGLDSTLWKPASLDTQYIEFDAGAGNTTTADYLALGVHNLNSAGAEVCLEASNDNFASDYSRPVAPFNPANNEAIVKEFASLSKRYWRIRLCGNSYESRYEYSNSQDGWVASGATVTLNPTSVTLASTSTDPTWSKSGLIINGKNLFKIRVRLKRTAGAGWQGTCYYATAGHSYSESYKKTVSQPAGLDQLQVIEWDMSQLTAGGTDWINNMITGIRFDFGSSSSDVFEIDYIEIAPKFSSTPYIGLAQWGQLTELDFADGKFDPYGEEFKGNINVTETGYLAGVHVKHYERQIDLAFEDADDALYQKIKDWWYTTGMMCFFMAWEKTGHSSDVWVVRPEKKFNNPLTNGGAYRDIKISLRGRR